MDEKKIQFQINAESVRTQLTSNDISPVRTSESNVNREISDYLEWLDDFEQQSRNVKLMIK